MHTTLELLALAKEKLAPKHDLPSPMTDYRLAKLMGLKLQTLSSWRTGRTHIGGEFAAKFAEACDLSSEYVYACVEAERTDDPLLRKILANIAATFSVQRVPHRKTARRAGRAAVALLALGAGFVGLSAPTPASSAALQDTNTSYYVKRRVWRRAGNEHFPPRPPRRHRRRRHQHRDHITADLPLAA